MSSPKFYKTDISSALIAVVLLIAFFTLVWLNDGRSDGTPFPILLIVILTILMFIVTGSEYYAIKDQVLIRRRFYLLSKTIHLKSIKALRKGGYYRILPSVYPALHLVYDDRGIERIALLRYHSFGEKTLARLAADLHQRNPRIEIDRDVRKLIEGKRG
jgi:hypothetical protein